MGNNNQHLFKISVQSANAIAIITVIVNVISKKFGTYTYYSGGRYGSMEMLGILIPLMVLIVPVFVKKYREECWNVKAVLISLCVLIISVILISIMYANKNYYRILWIEEGPWTRSDSPQIRWDFWNIIGKSA